MNSNDIPLETFLRAVAMEAEQEFRERGELPLTWFFHESMDGEDCKAVILNVCADNKLAIADMMRSLFWEKHVTRYAVATESWGSKAGVIPPSSDPQRCEMLSIHAEDASGTIGAVIDIDRSANGKPTLGKLKVDELMAPESERAGRFVNLLPPASEPNSWDPSAEVRAEVEAWAQKLGVARFYICAITEILGDIDIPKPGPGPVKMSVNIVNAFRSHEQAIAAAADALDGEALTWTNPRRTAVAGRRAYIIQRIDIAELTKVPGHKTAPARKVTLDS